MKTSQNLGLSTRPVGTLPDGRKVGRIVLKHTDSMNEEDYTFVAGLLWVKRDGFVQLVAEIRD